MKKINKIVNLTDKREYIAIPGDNPGSIKDILVLEPVAVPIAIIKHSIKIHNPIVVDGCGIEVASRVFELNFIPEKISGTIYLIPNELKHLEQFKGRKDIYVPLERYANGQRTITFISPIGI